MERFRDLEEDLSDLSSYNNGTGLSLEEQKELFSNRESLKEYLYDKWFRDIMENSVTVARYCDDENVAEKIWENEWEDGLEDTLMESYVDWLMDEYSFWWAGHDTLPEIQPDDRVKLYRAVGANDFSDISLSQEHLGNCWTYDRETAKTIDACLVGRKRFIFEAEVKADCIDFVLSAIYQSWDDSFMEEREVRVIDTDGIDLLKVVDVDGNVYWGKE